MIAAETCCRRISKNQTSAGSNLAAQIPISEIFFLQRQVTGRSTDLCLLESLIRIRVLELKDARRPREVVVNRR